MTTNNSGVNVIALANRLAKAFLVGDDDARHAAHVEIENLTNSERIEMAQYADAKVDEWRAAGPFQSPYSLIWARVKRRATNLSTPFPLTAG